MGDKHCNAVSLHKLSHVGTSQWICHKCELNKQQSQSWCPWFTMWALKDVETQPTMRVHWSRKNDVTLSRSTSKAWMTTHWKQALFPTLWLWMHVSFLVCRVSCIMTIWLAGTWKFAKYSGIWTDGFACLRTLFWNLLSQQRQQGCLAKANPRLWLLSPKPLLWQPSVRPWHKSSIVLNHNNPLEPSRTGWLHCCYCVLQMFAVHWLPLFDDTVFLNSDVFP